MFDNYRNTVINIVIFPSLLGDSNTEYRPFFIQITVSPSKKLANTEYRHIVRPPITWFQSKITCIQQGRTYD